MLAVSGDDGNANVTNAENGAKTNDDYSRDDENNGSNEVLASKQFASPSRSPVHTRYIAQIENYTNSSAVASVSASASTASLHLNSELVDYMSFVFTSIDGGHY